MKTSKFKKRILHEYIGVASKIVKAMHVVDETNYYDISRNIERDVQRMIGRLKYR